MSHLVVTAHDGLELAVRDHGGEGPDIVFVHGVMRTLEDWAPVLGRLPGVRAVAMDLRFHGRSGAPETASWDDFVRDIDSVVDQLGLSNPFVVGHSFGGVLAMAYAVAHPECPGVMNIDGFDLRQRELFDELEPGVVDAFLEEFRERSTSFVPADAGDDAWLEEQRAQLRQMGDMWKVPDDVSAAGFDRAFVRTQDGWERRPPNRINFFDVNNGEDGTADPLAMLRQIAGPVVYVVCRPPDDEGMFATARAGLERHVDAIAAEHKNVRLETIVATHGVIFEKPDDIAAMVASLVTA
jgi:pimeloyl-ACP methyl ester carboxylesterase